MEMGERFDFNTFLTNLWQSENMDGYNKIEGKGGYNINIVTDKIIPLIFNH